MIEFYLSQLPETNKITLITQTKTKYKSPKQRERERGKKTTKKNSMLESLVVGFMVPVIHSAGTGNSQCYFPLAYSHPHYLYDVFWSTILTE